MKKFIGILILLVILAICAALVKIYLGVKEVKEYVGFVTDSVNDLNLEFESINRLLNDFEYSEEGQHEMSFETELGEIKSVYNQIDQKKQNSKMPYKGDEIGREFDEYLEIASGSIDAYEDVVNAIKTLKKKEKVANKLEEYIEVSVELQPKSENLEKELSDYVQEFSKFDINRILNEIKSI